MESKTEQRLTQEKPTETSVLYTPVGWVGWVAGTYQSSPDDFGLCCKNGGSGRVESLCSFARSLSMSKSSAFKWRHYEPEIILLCVRWYLAYPLSYRQVAEMVNERGLDIHYTTVFR